MDPNSAAVAVVTGIVLVIAAVLREVVITIFQGIIQVLILLVVMEAIDVAVAQVIQTDHPIGVIEETPEIGPLTAARAGPAHGMTPETAVMDILMVVDRRIEAGKAARSRMANMPVEASWEGETAEDKQDMEMKMTFE